MFGSTLLAGRVAAFCVYAIRLKRCKCLFAQVKYFDQRFGAGDGFAHDMKQRQKSCKRFDFSAAGEIESLRCWFYELGFR